LIFQIEKLPSVKDLSVANKTVLLRTNYDVPLLRQPADQGKPLIADTSRIDESLPTINYLLEQKAKLIILSHLGRPEGKINQDLSLKPVAQYLSGLLKREIPLFLRIEEVDKNQPMMMLENLRFWPEEEKNDLSFAKNLANLGDFFVNEAFACSHRQHASIVGLPQFLLSAFGLDFLKEIEVLSEIRENPRRPVTLILGGAKKDKLEIVGKLLNWADNILIGGKLPELITNYQINQLPIKNSGKLIIASLKEDGKDITLESINKFKEIIRLSGTILWAGPMGVFEEPGSKEGTRQIAQAVSESQAFKVVGGGDTEAALTKFNLESKINFIVKQQTMFISSGGGAMFEFLAKGTLSGIEAIEQK